MPVSIDTQILDAECKAVSTSVDDYTVHIDSVDAPTWNRIVAGFEDASLAQTWSYGVTRWGRDNLSHVVLRKNGEVVAAAQVVIKKVPLLKAGLAYVKAGPLWYSKAGGASTATQGRMLQALRDIFVTQRGLLLRIFVAGCHRCYSSPEQIFAQEGFFRDASISRPSTAIVDLSHSLKDLRDSLRPTWRRNLVLAERREFKIVEGGSDELFGVFEDLYREMLDRKSIAGVVSIRQYRRMQAELPDPLKMRIMICEHEGAPVAGLVVPWIGNSGQNLLAATGNKGLELRSSYLLHWRMLERLKADGFRWYDLDAINHKAYPGISQFKLGMAGRLGWEAEYFGQFQSCSSAWSVQCVGIAEKLKDAYVASRVAWKRFGSFRASVRLPERRDTA
jgi:peptidoglycan pentaglycine glycine transferase (the first glycine)